MYEAKLVTEEGPDQENKIVGIGNVIKEDSTSTLPELLRLTAWLLRFRDRMMKRSVEEEPLKASELRRARLIWDLFIQDRCYSGVV